MNYLQNNLKEFKIIFNCLKRVYAKKHINLSFKDIVFDDFLQKKKLKTEYEYDNESDDEEEKYDSEIGEILVEMSDFCIDGISIEINKIQKQAKREKVKKSLEFEEKFGFKYFIDNQLIYYYFDEEDDFKEINFQNIFQESLKKRFVSDNDYKKIQKFLGEQAVKYFYFCFKKLLKETI